METTDAYSSFVKLIALRNAGDANALAAFERALDPAETAALDAANAELESSMLIVNQRRGEVDAAQRTYDGARANLRASKSNANVTTVAEAEVKLEVAKKCAAIVATLESDGLAAVARATKALEAARYERHRRATPDEACAPELAELLRLANEAREIRGRIVAKCEHMTALLKERARTALAIGATEPVENPVYAVFAAVERITRGAERDAMRAAFATCNGDAHAVARMQYLHIDALVARMHECDFFHEWQQSQRAARPVVAPPAAPATPTEEPTTLPEARIRVNEKRADAFNKANPNGGRAS